MRHSILAPCTLNLAPILRVLALTACALLLPSCGAAQAAPQERRPNFIIIIADDLGYGDLGCYGSERNATPHIDALAAAGLRFTQFYANSAVCSPTRAALMTGRYQQRADIAGVVTAANHRDHGMSPEEITFARLLQQSGYATALYGKWHLGYQPRFNPVAHGFDEFRGFVSGNVDYFSHIDQTGRFDWWHNDQQAREQGYATHLITQHGVRFIREHREEPFALVLAHAAPHYPYQGPGDKAERTVGGEFPYQGARADRRVAYSEMIAELDKGVGTIVAALRDAGIDDRTLILFVSDNGATQVGSNGSLRGHKSTCFEGGIRVPAIAHWPGRIAPGVSDEPLMTMDIMPTLLELAGVAARDDRPLDGVSMQPVFRGESIGERTLHWQLGRHRAMRRGPWKLLLTSQANAPMLFHLADDPAEQHDRAAEHPQRVETMRRDLEAWLAEVRG